MERNNGRGGARSLNVSKWLAAGLAIGVAQVAAGQDESRLDRLWSKSVLYTGGDESKVQRVALSGRVQFDQVNIDGSTGQFSDTDLRRLRFGVKVGFHDDFTFHAEAEADPQGGDLNYTRLTDAYLAWSRSDALELTIGKHGVGFTMDGQTSSKELLTIDRSNLSNNIWFTEEYVPGVSVSGERSKLVYDIGFFSSGGKDRGFGGSDGGEFVLATIGRDFSERLGAREALLRLNLVDNEPDPNNGFTRPLEHIASINFSFETNRWGVRADLSSATGYLGQPDLFGVMVMPFYNLRPQLQLVTRYTYVDSEGANGVRHGRYENLIAGGRGDEYSEIYAGVNYYPYGHKLKLQTGLQYADMNDAAADGGAFHGWTLTTGFRISW